MGARLAPGRVALAVALGFLVWGLFDVRGRARLDPNDLGSHRTDFTVYTEAGAAFFDGRDPYSVTNARGWHYLYPPLFAILVAPLHSLDPGWQGYLWFALSVAMAYGCFAECRRIAARLAVPAPGESPGKRDLRGWIVLCAGLAVLCPLVNTFQRGQVGVAVLYPLLLGYRMLVGARGAGGLVGGGVLLALPIALKVTPAMPVGIALFQPFVGALRGAGWRRFLLPSAGVLLGLLLFLLVVPAALVGWGDNLRHLESFTTRVATNEDLGPDENFNRRSLRNQSLANGLYRFGNFVEQLVAGGPDDRMADDFTRARETLPMDAPSVKRALLAARALMAALLLLVAARWHSGTDRIGQAAAFGLACATTLPFSPISWGHHFVILLPAALFLPLSMRHLGRLPAARTLAISAAALTLLHYGWLERGLGRIGFLGLGMTVWCVGGALVLLRRPRAPPLISPA